MSRKPSTASNTNYDVKDDGPAYVGIIFCPECNNMLYPREDKENKVITFK
jgi:DNA-directed RNA polymerase II subunit RPB9